MFPRSFAIALAAAGLVLTVTVVPGVFTVDEDNYLVTVVGLRDGRLTVPGTEGLTPSRELLWFDPAGRYREVQKTPVTATAPPLFAPLALPFAALGWRGLVGLETLAFLAAAAVVFAYARRYATDPSTPWLAAAAFALGGYSIEYAQGAWPHMLTAALAVAALYLAARTRDGAALPYAFAAGLAAGIATGVRYQNVLLAGCVGLGVLLWAPRRIRASALYGAGVAVPLAVCSLLNRLRLGSFNPVSKGPGYLAFGDRPRLRGPLADAVTMAWARVVDFAARPPLTGTEHATYLHPDAATGAYLIGSAVKKAWLQSAPWIALALAACLAAWLSRRRPAGPVAAGAPSTPEAGRELRAVALVVFPVVAMFSAAGVTRTDGLCFNQRYLLELVPLVAVAFALTLDGTLGGTTGGPTGRRWLGTGAVGGLAAGWAAVAGDPGDIVRTVVLLRLPLGIAAALVVLWAVHRRRSRSVTPPDHAASRSGRWLAAVAGAALGWALAVHLGDDLPASRALRRQSVALERAYERALPTPSEPAALVAWWGMKDAAGPLLLDRDLVVLDARNDDGETLGRLIDDLQAAGRRVLVVATAFPRRPLGAALAGRTTRTVRSAPVTLLEVAPAAGPTAAGPAGGG